MDRGGDVEGRGGSQAPRLSRPTVLRDRLIERLLARWTSPVTVVTAGAGFGKTTLVAHAVTENELDPRGFDRWITCRRHDTTAASLAAAIMQALGEPPLHGGAIADGATRIAEAIHARAPLHVCLVLDDVHHLESDSPAVALLGDLMDELPSNGHVVLVGRTDPPVNLARRRAAGDVNDIGEHELRFTDDEARAFAAMRVATPGSIAAAGGWPALAELLATTNRTVAVAYLWDEVLSRFDEERRRALAMLHTIGGADSEVLSTVLGRPVDVRELIRAMPMATITDDGRASVHDLWGPALTRFLSSEERRAGCWQAAVATRARGEFASAVRLFAAVGALSEVLELVRRVCADSHPLIPGEVLRDWYRAIVDGGLGDTAEAALLAGAVRKPADPLGSIPFFELAVNRFAQRDDVDGEISAIFHLGHIAWWHEDYDLMIRLLERGTQLAAAGSDLAASIVTLGPLVLGEVLGDADAVVAAARSSRREHQHSEIVPLTDFLEARAHLTNGDPRAALAPATRACEAATPTMRPPAEFERLSCLWALGHRDEVVARVDSAMAELDEVGWLHNRAANGAQAALWLCTAGHVAAARSMLDRANLVRDSAGAWARALVSLADVMVRLGTGDEPGAATVMQCELAARPLADPSVVRAHRAWLPLSYVLAPEARGIWDAAPLRGSVAQGRVAGRAIVALRDGAPIDSESLRGLDLAALRAQLPVPWLADLATLFAAQGQQGDAEEVLHGVKDALLRTRLRDLSKHAPKPMRPAASALLGSHAVPPERSVRVCVLGPLRLDFDGHDEWPSQFNRKAVRGLLLLLVENGTITRTRVGSLLWPDLDDDAVRNNLRVTLTYLTHALQPDRLAHEPSHFIEDFGDAIRLRPGASLQLDIVEFHEALHRAAEHERRGAASHALGEYRRAVALYRGDYLASVDDAEWAFASRERERLAFVKAAVRAGELSLARGDFEEATELALRSVGVDPWSEPARRLLADARMVGGDRSGALRSLEDCARMLADLGIDAEPETRILARRVGFRGL